WSWLYSVTNDRVGLAGFLQLQHVAEDGVGEPDAAGPGDCIGHLLSLHVAPGVLGKAAAHGAAFGVGRGEHLLHQRVEEDALELLRLRLEMAELRRRAHSVSGRGDAADHHSTSISACSAPEALMACRIAIRSRGLMPSAL